MKSDTQTLIGALRVLARDIETDDGVVNALLDEAAQRLEELDDTWLSASETLPDSGVAVLAVANDGISKPFVIRAMYVAKHTLESAPDYEGDCYYEEVTDTYYCKPGWYENNCYEYTHCGVDYEVTHWMPIPAPPSR
jgi:hypothetical protein